MAEFSNEYVTGVMIDKCEIKADISTAVLVYRPITICWCFNICGLSPLALWGTPPMAPPDQVIPNFVITPQRTKLRHCITLQ